MKRTLTIASFALALAAVLPAMAQQYTSGGSAISRIGGRIFYAEEYNLKAAGLFVVSGNAATGSSSITVSSGNVKLRDGRAVVPFAVGVPITINDYNQETVTLTAVSGCTPSGTTRDPFNAQTSLCTLTGSFGSLHGAGAQIWSGDSGILEALNDAGNAGGGTVYWNVDCGIITLNTSTGATTTTTCNVPKTFVPDGASVYVTTTIATSASYSVGIASNTAAFVTSCSSLTAGLNCYAFQTTPASIALSTYTGVTPLLITANAQASAGKVHLTAWGHTAAQSNY